jgi:hypothetical protein
MSLRNLLFALAISLFSLPAFATVVYVDSTQAGGTQNGSSWATAFSNFQSGINAANAGDSVWVAKGTYLPDSASYFVMKEGVKIFGGFLNTNNAFAQRNFQNNITRLKANYGSIIRNDQNGLTSAAMIDGFTITGAHIVRSYAYSGAAMYNAMASPTISNCTFSDNSLTLAPFVTQVILKGGGIYNYRSNPVISHCTFTNNSVEGYLGYTIDQVSGGGGICNDESSPTVSSCTFNNNNTVVSGTGSNSGNGGSGGGICNISFTISNPSAPVITDCSFSNNKAYFGGGIFTYSYGSLSMVMSNCTFTGNTGYGGGGGMMNEEGEPTISDCTFSGNFSKNAGGGGMSNWGSNAIVTNCSFTGNSSTTNSFGSSDQKIGGGGMMNYNCTPTISNCIFSANTSFKSSADYGGGGGMYNSQANATVTNCTFINNTGSGSYLYNGGAGFVGGGGMYNYSSSPNVSQCTFTSNKGNEVTGGSDRGGGGAVYNTNGFAHFTQCTFSNNTGYGNNKKGGGGAIYSYNGGLILSECTFNNNTAGNGGNGGAVYTDFQNYFDFSDCSFSGNTAAGASGGVMYNINLYSTSQNSSIENCSFKANTAKTGGVFYNYSSSYIDISNCLFAQNKSDSVGAAIFNWNSRPRIANCSMLRNKANLNGSGIYNASGSTPQISNTILWGNFSGIYNDGTSSANIAYSLVQGLPADAVAHNLDGATNPLFVDTSGAGNYQLQSASPCMNTGNNDSIPYYITTDLAGNGRIYAAIVDMGALEYTILQPVVNLGNDTSFCTGGSITLQANYYSGTTYAWSTGASSQSIVVNASGVYYVTLTNTEGTATDTIEVTINSLPIVNLGNDATIVAGTSLTLDAGNPGATYLWSTGATTQTITVNTPGSYSVTVTNSNGCSATDAITLTPNPEGINDVNKATNTFTIAPNPAKEMVRINISDMNLLNTKAILTDAYGRVVAEIMINNKSQELLLSGFANGIYILKMQNGQALKVVKE